MATGAAGFAALKDLIMSAQGAKPNEDHWATEDDADHLYPTKDAYNKRFVRRSR